MKVTHPEPGAHSLVMPGLARRWWFAIRPGALPKVLFPMGLGIVLALTRGGFPGVGGVVRAVLAGVLIQLATLLFNDLGDAEADRFHLRLAPDSLGPRVIPLGWLSARALAVAAMSATAGFLVLSIWQQSHGGSRGMLVLCLCALAMPMLYSLPPVRLNYRGGGEVLEILGIGLLLPWLGWAFCGLPLDSFPWLWWLPAMTLAGSSSLGSGLGHCDVDRQTGKNTLAVRSGPRFAAGASLFLMALALCAVFGLALTEPGVNPWLRVASLVLPGWVVFRLARLVPRLAELPLQPHESFHSGQPGTFKREQKALLLLLWLCLLTLPLLSNLGLSPSGRMLASQLVLP
jgi:1,4-dihydroxy-2-naphthoate octaprenyltransferase